MRVKILLSNLDKSEDLTQVLSSEGYTPTSYQYFDELINSFSNHSYSGCIIFELNQSTYEQMEILVQYLTYAEDQKLYPKIRLYIIANKEDLEPFLHFFTFDYIDYLGDDSNDISYILTKMAQAHGEIQKCITHYNLNSDQAQDSLYQIKLQMVAIRNTLSHTNNGDVHNIALQNLQSQLNKLSVYLSRFQNLSSSRSFPICMQIVHVLNKTGWDKCKIHELDQSLLLNANFDYCHKAIEDLLTKLISLARKPQNFEVYQHHTNTKIILEFRILKSQESENKNDCNLQAFDFVVKTLGFNNIAVNVKCYDQYTSLELEIPASLITKDQKCAA